jgi:hypothetical protein
MQPEDEGERRRRDRGERRPRGDREGEHEQNDGSEGAPAPQDPPKETEPPEENPASVPQPDAATKNQNGKCPGVGEWRVKNWDVDELVGKSLLFFEAQESGVLRAGHRVKWRGDSYLTDKIGKTSLAGGWFDAGGAVPPVAQQKQQSLLHSWLLHVSPCVLQIPCFPNA